MKTWSGVKLRSSMHPTTRYSYAASSITQSPINPRQISSIKHSQKIPPSTRFSSKSVFSNSVRRPLSTHTVVRNMGATHPRAFSQHVSWTRPGINHLQNMNFKFSAVCLVSSPRASVQIQRSVQTSASKKLTTLSSLFTKTITTPRNSLLLSMNSPGESLGTFLMSNKSQATYCTEASSISDLEKFRKRVKWLTMERGIKENDLLLGTFSEKYLPSMSETELHQFYDLLQEIDWDIYYWITGAQPIPPEHDTELMKKLQAHCKSNPLKYSKKN